MFVHSMANFQEAVFPLYFWEFMFITNIVNFDRMRPSYLAERIKNNYKLFQPTRSRLQVNLHKHRI